MELALSSSNHGGGAGAGGLRVMRPFCFAALHVADGVAVLAFTTSPHLTGLRYVAVEHTTDPNAPAPVEALVTAMLAVWRQPEVAAKWAGAPVTPTRGPLAPSLVFFYRPLTAARHFVDAANHAEGPFINPDLDTSEVAQLDRALAAGAAAVGGGVARQPVARAYIIVDQDSGTRLYRSGDVGKAAGTFLVVPLLPPTEEGADDGVNVLDVGPHSQQLPAVFNPPVGTVVVSQVAKEPHDADGEKLWLRCARLRAWECGYRGGVNAERPPWYALRCVRPSHAPPLYCSRHAIPAAPVPAAASCSPRCCRGTARRSPRSTA